MSNMMNYTNQISEYLSSAYNALQNHGVEMPEKKNVKNLSPLINTVIAGEGLKRFQDIESAEAAEYQGEPDLRLVYDDENNFYGLYRYTLNNGFQIAETQFNADASLLWDKILYTNIGIIQGALNTNIPTSSKQLEALTQVGHHFGQQLYIKLTDASYLFANTIYDKMPKLLSTYETTNMAYMFYNCRNLHTVPELYYDSVQNMENIFLDSPNFSNASLNLILATLPNFSSLINPSSNNLDSYLGLNYNIVNYNIPRASMRMAYNNGWNVPIDWETLIINYNTISNAAIQTATLQEPEDGFDVYMLSNFTNTIGKDIVITMNIQGMQNLQGAETHKRIGIFNQCINLTDITFDNTSNLIYMHEFFNGCSKLQNITGLNTISAKIISNLFRGCSNLTTVPTLSLNNVEIAYGMFAGCSNLNIIPELHLGNVSNFSNMFADCYNLLDTPYINTDNAYLLDYMFSNCSNLQTVYNYNTTRVTSMDKTFLRCSNLMNIPDFDTSNVISMSYTFAYCKNLTTLPNLNVEKVQDASGLFSSMQLTDIPTTYNFNNLINSSDMFSYSTIVNIPYIHTNNVSDASKMFFNCHNLTNFIQSEFNFSKALNFNSMFGYAQVASFPNIITTNRLVDTSLMFVECSNLIEAPTFETTGVRDASKMFYNCTYLTEVPLYNLSAATNLENMFYNCYNLSDNAYANIINALPNAARLTNRYIENIGLNSERLMVSQMVILGQKGYYGFIIPPYEVSHTTVYDTSNYITQTIERGI